MISKDTQCALWVFYELNNQSLRNFTWYFKFDKFLEDTQCAPCVFYDIYYLIFRSTAHTVQIVSHLQLGLFKICTEYTFYLTHI